jgi:hypothetical protein
VVVVVHQQQPPHRTLCSSKQKMASLQQRASMACMATTLQLIDRTQALQHHSNSSRVQQGPSSMLALAATCSGSLRQPSSTSQQATS